MSGLIIEPKWSIREAQLDINNLWEEVDRKICKMITEKLLSTDPPIIIKEKVKLFSYEPDWSFPEDWKIVTLVKRVYSCRGSHDTEEKLNFVTGRLFVEKAGIRLDNSFRFVLDKEKKSLFIDLPVIRRAIEDSTNVLQECLSSSAIDMIFNQAIKIGKFNSSRLDERTDRDLKNAFRSLGFTKDEINLTVHNILTHDSFKESMALEDLVNLGLKSR